MENLKKTMLFLDLEGTIIDEETGKMQVEEINNLLNSLERLQKNTNSIVNIHIVSPILLEQMEKVIDNLDNIIVRYNIKNKTLIREIESAVAYPDNGYIHQHDLYDRIFPMRITMEEDGGKYGKLDFVRKWVESLEGKTNLIIYGGNGINDTSAMKYVKNQKNGFVICPQNSHKEVKKIADYISDKNESEGIKDGIDFINKQIEKRIDNNKEERQME